MISVSVTVEPRDLEDLLEALARLEYPINPQIYHDGALIFSSTEGPERICPTTVVEFPAYESWVPEVRRTLEAYGFRSDCVHVSDMLAEIHASVRQVRVGSQTAVLVKRMSTAAAAAN